MSTPQNHILSNTWHILGAGAIGGLFACRFSEQLDIELILKPSVEPPEAVLLDNAAYTIPSSTSESSESIDVLWVTTKCFDALDAIRSIQHRLHENSVIVVMINGLGVQQEILS